MARWVGCWGLGGGWGDGWVRGLPGDWSGDWVDVGGAEGIGSGVVVVVGVTATGEEAFDDAFEAGHAFGQGLDILAEIRQV